MDWLDKRELHTGLLTRSHAGSVSRVSSSPSVISSSSQVSVVRQQRQRLVDLREKRAELSRKRKERESYLSYLRSLFAASSNPSSRQSTACSSTRPSRVVHIALGETWNLMEMRERELERSLQQLSER